MTLTTFQFSLFPRRRDVRADSLAAGEIRKSFPPLFVLSHLQLLQIPPGEVGPANRLETDNLKKENSVYGISYFLSLSSVHIPYLVS